MSAYRTPGERTPDQEPFDPNAEFEARARKLRRLAVGLSILTATLQLITATIQLLLGNWIVVALAVVASALFFYSAYTQLRI